MVGRILYLLSCRALPHSSSSVSRNSFVCTHAKTAGAYANNSQSGPHHPSLVFKFFLFKLLCFFFELANQVFSFQPIPRSSAKHQRCGTPSPPFGTPHSHTARNVRSSHDFPPGTRLSHPFRTQYNELFAPRGGNPPWPLRNRQSTFPSSPTSLLLILRSQKTARAWARRSKR